MSESFDTLLAQRQRTWLVTGVAGFIGSHLLEKLLLSNQQVCGMDNFSTGSETNLNKVQARVGAEAWERFRFIQADICDEQSCAEAMQGVEFVLHQAALGSVPRSILSPEATARANVEGSVNIFAAAVRAKVSRVVYASSSSVYGDIESPEKVEAEIGNPLSPYAASKRCCEVFANSLASCSGLESVGLRYFNVFGPRQDPNGNYAAVIPRWIQTLGSGQQGIIYGDGETSRDFCYVDNIVAANLRAALHPHIKGSTVFNVGTGKSTTLKALYRLITDSVSQHQGRNDFVLKDPLFEDFRVGDVRHSLASLVKVESILDYKVQVHLAQGISLTVQSFLSAEK